MSFFDSLRGLFGGSGQAPAAPPTPAAPVAPASTVVTAGLLTQLGVRSSTALTWAAPIATACGRHRIDSAQRVAAFLANVLHESTRLEATVENLNYSAEALLKQWPLHFTPDLAERVGRTAAHPADQKQIAENAYGGRMGNGPVGSGDGWLWRGRGLIQLTGRANYMTFATKIGVPVANLPAILETTSGASESAAAFWEASTCNVVADRGDIAGTRRIVNGGTNGLAEVTALYQTALAALR